MAWLQEQIEQSERHALIADEEGKSFWWVLSLCIGELPPEFDIVLPSDVTKYSEQNPSVQKFVYLDDAMYSGRQARANIGTVVEALSECVREDGQFVPRVIPGKKVICAVPFATRHAIDVLMDSFDKNAFVLRASREIDSLGKILSESPSGDLREEFLRVYGGLLRQGEENLDTLTLTYFDHKRPDPYSFFAGVRSGVVVDSKTGKPKRSLAGLGGKMYKPFLPEITSPYKNRKVIDVVPSAGPHIWHS